MLMFLGQGNSGGTDDVDSGFSRSLTGLSSSKYKLLQFITFLL